MTLKNLDGPPAIAKKSFRPSEFHYSINHSICQSLKVYKANQSPPTVPYHSRMKVLNILLLVLCASSASAVGVGNGNGNNQGIPVEVAGGAIPVEAAGGAIPDEYLVVLDEGVEPQGLLKGLIKSGRAEILYEFNIIKGFAVRMKLNALQNALKNIEGVTVHENLVVTAIAVDSPVYSWGIDRSDQTTGTNNQYKYERDGNNVDVYILDTGITIEHADFEGRASHGPDYTGEGKYDGHGHGTHVAGTFPPRIFVFLSLCVTIHVLCSL
jgi:subtilisin family serine protease